VKGATQDEMRGLAEDEVKVETNEDKEQKKPLDPTSIDHLHKEGIIQKPIHGALAKLGYHKLTPVQEKSIMPVLTTDADFITKAKTGTGKTLAFGIPLIEESLRLGHGRDQGVVGLVIAPTRDLAFQIRDEINKIVRFKEMVKHTKNMLSVQTLVGGESRWKQMQAFNSKMPVPSIVVATPGRFIDMIKEPSVAEAFEDVRAVVLDEADRLLGEGFKEDLVEITDILKDNLKSEKVFKTMLYSATWDKDVQEFSKRILRPKYQFLDTVDKNAPETHEKIDQSLILTSNIFESYVAATLFIENESRAASRNFKAIVFLPTVKSVNYFYELLSTRMKFKKNKMAVHQLHGQMTQFARDRAVKEFRKNFSGILVCSDVGARGMDFPNVTNVIQIGLPMDSTNYVHRVGRTARGGKEGRAVMILSKAESRFIRVLKARNIDVNSQFEYEKDTEAENDIAQISQQARHKYSLDLVVESLAGFSKGIAGTYRLNFFEILEELTQSYSRFYQDDNKKPHVTIGFASRVLGLNKRDSHKFFDLGDETQSLGRSNRGNRDRTDKDIDNDRGYHRHNDRDNSRSYQRSRAGFRNDRSERDDTEERSGKGYYNDRRGKSNFHKGGSQTQKGRYNRKERF
jgi:ATP-dependent RNA helicase MSS116